MILGDFDGNWYNVHETWPEALLPDQSLPVAKRRRHFNFSFGDLELMHISLQDIHIIFGDIRLKKPSFRVRTWEMPGTVELHFVLSGNGALYNNDNGKTYRFKASEHNLMYTPDFDGTATYDINEPCIFFEVHFLRSYFMQLCENTHTLLERFSEKVARGEESKAASENMPVTLEMRECIRSIMHSRFTGKINTLFLQSKCIELLALQTEALEKQERRPADTILKTADDKSRIVYARDYLIEHMANPPSLTQLATLAGTNTFKLKNGFKELYQQSVFSYLTQVKLSHARELLLSGLPVKEVADQLGYSSVQHFTTAFRKQFGITPARIM